MAYRGKNQNVIGKRQDSSLAVVLWGMLLAVPFIVVLGILHGFVIMKLWGWFVVPTFHSAPTLHIAAAWGIGMLVSYITQEHPKKDENYMASAVASPFVVLLFGWILSHWVG
jgi:hypothetical protein